jgi:hypothetical protein
MFKPGDRVVLSPDGIKYLQQLAPNLLEVYIDRPLILVKNQYVKNGLVVERAPGRWIDYVPKHFQPFIEFEDEYV